MIHIFSHVYSFLFFNYFLLLPHYNAATEGYNASANFLTFTYMFLSFQA